MATLNILIDYVEENLKEEYEEDIVVVNFNKEKQSSNEQRKAWIAWRSWSPKTKGERRAKSSHQLNNKNKTF